MRRSTFAVAFALVAAVAPSASAETPASLCDAILNRHQNNWGINLLDYHVGSTVNPSSTALQNIKDCKQGNQSVTGDGCSSVGTRVQLRMDMLAPMKSLNADRGFTFRVTAIAGSKHSCPGSMHYKGRAFDVDRVNGSEVSKSTPHEPFRKACIDMGADEAYGPAYDPVGGHDTHIHCAWYA